MSWSELAAFYHQAADRACVLATLVEKRGSSYRQPGARLLVRADGVFCGSVSAGCLEEEICRVAADVRRENLPRLLTIDTRPHYGCPGQITVLLEPLQPAAGTSLFRIIENNLRERHPFTVTTDYRHLTRTAVLTRVVDQGVEEEPTPGVLYQRVGRSPRLIVIGNGEDATTLAQFARLAKWEVHTIPAAEVQFAAQRLAEHFRPDDRTAFVLMTHNLGCDVACLDVILPQEYSYVGVIGSLRRRAELLHGLESTGNAAALAASERLFCPAGLDLGAADPGEIALSILAEIQCGWSGRGAGSLRLRTTPIHHESPA